MKKESQNRLKASPHLSELTLAANDWISQSEAARIRGVSRQAIFQLIKKRRFQILRTRGNILLKRSEIQAYRPVQGRRPRKKLSRP